MSVLFEPTAEQRRMVRAFSGLGVQQEEMADHLGIDSNTLRKHFREELDRGTVEANVKVAQSLFQMATQGKNGAAAIFWMKSRGPLAGQARGRGFCRRQNAARDGGVVPLGRPER